VPASRKKGLKTPLALIGRILKKKSLRKGKRGVVDAWLLISQRIEPMLQLSSANGGKEHHSSEDKIREFEQALGKKKTVGGAPCPG